jgi:hypothetical protein
MRDAEDPPHESGGPGVEIVHENDRARPEAGPHRAQNGRGSRASQSVAAVDAPPDVEQVQLAHEQVQGRIRLVERRAEEAWSRADGPADGALRLKQLPPHVVRGQVE